MVAQSVIDIQTDTGASLHPPAHTSTHKSLIHKSTVSPKNKLIMRIEVLTTGGGGVGVGGQTLAFLHLHHEQGALEQEGWRATPKRTLGRCNFPRESWKICWRVTTLSAPATSSEIQSKSCSKSRATTMRQQTHCKKTTTKKHNFFFGGGAKTVI